MIVRENTSHSGKYHDLFREAYQFLKNIDNGNYVDPNGTTFKNLAEYYGHMADFIAQGSVGYKYIMLPLDEEVFEINLDTRTIAIPASFSACASVQSDQLAETIMFVADRYFDYMDLATTEIFVQWETPADKKNDIKSIKGATHIEMIDLESEPGRIKFAWPLNDVITAVPGVVKFSIRFCRLNDGNVDKLFYSLNTLESSINIKPALNASMPSDENKIEKPFGENLFKNAIVNSNYSTEGVTPPTMPEFGAPGEDIFSSNGIIYVGDAKITHLKNDTVTLYAQAHTADINSLVEYKWYYKATGDNAYYDCQNYPTAESFFGENRQLIRAGKDAEGLLDVNVMAVNDANMDFQIDLSEEIFAENIANGTVYFIKVSSNNYEKAMAFNEGVQYYVLKAETTPVFVDTKDEPIYMAVSLGSVKQKDYLPCDMIELRNTGKVYREVYYEKTSSGEYVEYDKDIDETTPDLYEEYTSFTVPATGTITGSYKVAAWGIKEVSGKENMKTHYPHVSGVCTIPEPNPIKLDDNLNAIEILKNNKAELKVAVAEDPYKPVLTYTWYGGHANAASLSKVSEEGTALEATDIGWYKVDISSTVNRTPISLTSKICKVVEPVQPVRVKSLNTSYKRYIVDSNSTTPINKVEDGYDVGFSAQKVLLHIDANVVAKDGYHEGLYTETELDANGNSTDKVIGFKYVWQMTVPDGQNKYINIDEKTPGFEFNKNPNELIITSAAKNPIMNIRCLVVNTLNNETAVFDHSCIGNVDSSIGNFPLVEGKMQAPYIYANETEAFVFGIEIIR